MTKFENVYFGLRPAMGAGTAASARPSPDGVTGRERASALAGTSETGSGRGGGGGDDGRVLSAKGRTDGGLGSRTTGLSRPTSMVHATWMVQPVSPRRKSASVGMKCRSTHSRTHSSRARKLRTPSDRPSNCTPANHCSKLVDLLRVNARLAPICRLGSASVPFDSSTAHNRSATDSPQAMDETTAPFPRSLQKSPDQDRPVDYGSSFPEAYASNPVRWPVEATLLSHHPEDPLMPRTTRGNRHNFIRTVPATNAPVSRVRTSVVCQRRHPIATPSQRTRWRYHPLSRCVHDDCSGTG